jgi:hypothetical protein
MFYAIGTRSLLCALKLKAMELGVDYIHGEVYNMAHETIDDRIFQVFIVFLPFPGASCYSCSYCCWSGLAFFTKNITIEMTLTMPLSRLWSKAHFFIGIKFVSNYFLDPPGL